MNAWRSAKREFDPTLAIAKYELFTQQRLLANPALAAKFGLDPDAVEQSIQEKYCPPACEHGKIVPLKFGLAQDDLSEDEFDGMTQTRSGGGPPSGGGSSGGTHLMINNIKITALQGNCPLIPMLGYESHGFYADTDTPGQGGNAFRQVNLIVTMEIPVNYNRTLTIEFIDLPNWMDDGWQDLGNPYLSGGVAWESDNYGSISVVQSEVAVLAGQNTVTCQLIVNGSGPNNGPHAGDNWIVRVKYTTPGGTLQKIDTVLTVWRRLWVETDVMQLPNGTLAPLTPVVDSNAKDQFKQACIEVLPYPNHPVGIVSGIENLPGFSNDLEVLDAQVTKLRSDVDQLKNELDNIPDKESIEYQEKENEYNEKYEELQQKLDEYYTLLEQYYNQVYANPRHIPDSTPEYWTLHLVGAFKFYYNPLGYSVCSTCYVFGMSITQLVNSHNQTILNAAAPIQNVNPQEYANYIAQYSISNALVVSWTTLHEIGHGFGLEHSNTGVMQNDFLPNLAFVAELKNGGKFSIEELLQIQKNGFFSREING